MQGDRRCRIDRWMASVFVLAATLARAATPTPEWVERGYGPNDGLPVSSASSARIDADGFLWIATHDGLARFDGQRFDVYDSMRFPAMSGNRVQSVHADPQGRVFAYTANGDWLAVRSGAVVSALTDTTAPPQVRHVDAASLCLTTATALRCPDGNGAFPERIRFPPAQTPLLALPAGPHNDWLITTTGEVWRDDAGAWRRLAQLSGVIGAEVPRMTMTSADGALWVALGDLLLRIDASGAKAAWQETWGLILQLREDARGRLWCGTTRGLYRIENGNPARVFISSEADVDSEYLQWLAPDGALWVRAGSRLWRFADADAAMDPAQAPVMTSSGRILDLLFEDDGTVWVTTLRDGVHRLGRARVALLGEAAGLGGGNVYSVAQDRDGTMWLGTLGDGLKALAPGGSSRTLGRDDGLPGANPWLVATGPDGSVHVGTYAPGLWRRAAGATRFEPMPLPDGLRGEQVLSITFDAAARMWLGTTAGAWRQSDGRWQRQWPADGKRVRVNAVAHDGSGGVWMGGAEGVWRLAGDSAEPVAETLLANTSVRDLFLAADGVLWISTDGRGLVRVGADDPRGLAALRLGRAQGLPSNSPHAVRADRGGNLWVNSNQGIFRLARAGIDDFVAGRSRRLSPLVLGLADGLTELEGNGGVQPSATLDRDGRLWFPSQRGVVRFDPDAMPLRDQAPRVVIDGMESEGQPLPLDGDPVLPVGVRNLLVRYGAADLRSGSGLRFRYRLLPLEQGWTDSDTARSAGFSGLQPGEYRFEVLAGNSDGVWAREPTALAFRVPHRWYETTTFRSAALVFILALAWLAVRLRGRRLRLRTAELDRQVHERTDELRTEKGRVESTLANLFEAHAQLAQTHAQIEDSNLRLAAQAQRLEALDHFRSRLLADVSHELRTPVMLVSLPLEELKAGAGALAPGDRGRLDLSLRQLDRLRALVEQLVGLVQAESGQMRLRLRRLDLLPLLREIIAGYRPMAERIGADLVLDTDAPRCELFGERQHLTTIFGNLVDNAIKHAPSGSRVTMRLHINDEQAIVEVQDHGPGFDPALAQQLFERFFRAGGPPRQGREGLGIGLALARELVELHGGRIAAASARGAGATFRVELPLGSAHVALDDLALEDTPSDALPPAMAHRSGDGRVLLVEDHPELAAYLAERLGERVPVACAASAEQAWAMLADDAGIRLVVSDVRLPGASGLELCRRLAHLPNAQRRPIILISAKATDGDHEAGLAAGAVAYLAKPFSFEALIEAIERACPALGARLAAPPVDPTTVDALLGVALGRLDDAAFAIGEWADRAHLSERQLRRRVNELTGQSPQAWLREQRLLRVRHLLRSGACRTLAEAGARCGLDNPAWLYRSYRARFGEH